MSGPSPRSVASDPPRRRGRPPSAAARDAVLAAASVLLEERGLAGFSVDEVGRRSKVSKSTIYKHWSGALAIAVEAYGNRVTDAIRVTFTGDPEKDLLDQVRRVARIYSGHTGRVITQILGASATVDGGPQMVRDGFFAERRTESLRLVEQAVDQGLWHVDFDPQLTIELLFGPIVFRALNGGPPLRPKDAVALARTALRGLATDPDDPKLAAAKRR